MKGGRTMFFKRENEFDLMRKELSEYNSEVYRQLSKKKLEDFTERAMSSLRGEAVFDESFIEQNKADAEKILNIALQKNRQIWNMSDGDVKQLYYRVFGRWSPYGIE